MIQHSETSDQDLKSHIRHARICFGGNKKLKIYGLLQCGAGKRMKRESRVFFSSGSEALQHGYLPCSHCMALKYKQWKKQFIL